MEPVLFEKVFMNDDESKCICLFSFRPYQEIVQVVALQGENQGISHGDHSKVL